MSNDDIASSHRYNPYDHFHELDGSGNSLKTGTLSDACVKIPMTAGCWEVSADVPLKWQLDAATAGTMGAAPHWQWAERWAFIPRIQPGGTAVLKVVRGKTTSGTYYVNKTAAK